MPVTSREVPPGSHMVRVFHGDKTPGKDPYDAVVLLRNLGNGVCEMAAACGDLTPEGNIEIGLKAMELGFNKMTLQALHGQRVTRWATWLRSDNLFNYFEIDLAAAAAKLATDNAL